MWVGELLRNEDTQGRGEKKVRMVVKGGAQQNGPSIFGFQEMHGIERRAIRGLGGLGWETSILVKGLRL